MKRSLDYVYEGQGYAYGENYVFSVDAGNWCSVGIHAEQSLNYADEILEATVKMVISSNHNDNVLDFISFDSLLYNPQSFSQMHPGVGEMFRRYPRLHRFPPGPSQVCD